MNKINKSFILIFICLFAASAHAKNGIFFTGEGGIATQTNLPSAESVGALKNTTSEPSAWRLGVGYNHDLYSCLGLGVEVGYGWYGKNTYDFGSYNKKVQSSTSEYLILLQGHLTQWDLIGKVGGIRHKITITKPATDTDQTKINLMAGLTLAYNFSDHWAVLGSYNHVFGQQSKNFDILTGTTVALNEYLFGVRYSF